jgi:hypothetical protein
MPPSGISENMCEWWGTMSLDATRKHRSRKGVPIFPVLTMCGSICSFLPDAPNDEPTQLSWEHKVEISTGFCRDRRARWGRYVERLCRTLGQTTGRCLPPAIAQTYMIVASTRGGDFSSPRYRFRLYTVPSHLLIIWKHRR